MESEEYAKVQLEKSGIDFKNIPMENILMTCKKYGGIISKENYEATINAINRIYGKVYECKQN